MAGRILSMKSSDSSWNRTRDLPACSTVPQPTAPPRACSVVCYVSTIMEEHPASSGFNPEDRDMMFLALPNYTASFPIRKVLTSVLNFVGMAVCTDCTVH